MTELTVADVERLAATVGLRIDPAMLDAVAQHLALLLAAGRLLDEFPLTEDVEPAPGFRP